jgi:hypothetical protein
MCLSGDLGPGVTYYHTTGDLFEKVDCRGLNGSAVVLAVLIQRLADAPSRPAKRTTTTAPAEPPA